MLDIRITLPWPSAALSPNSRDKWGKIRATKAARAEAQYEMMIQSPNQYYPDVKRLTIEYYFHPASRTHFDLDGMVSRMKAAQDGIFEYIGLNDNLIRRLVAQICEIRKPGEVEVRIFEERS